MSEENTEKSLYKVLVWNAVADFGTAFVYILDITIKNYCSALVFLIDSFELNSVFLAIWLASKVYRVMRTPKDASISFVGDETDSLVQDDHPLPITRPIRTVGDIIDYFDKYDWYLPPISSFILACIIAAIPLCCNIYGNSGVAWCYIRCDLSPLQMFFWLNLTLYFWVLLAIFFMAVMFLPRIFCITAKWTSRTNWHYGLPIAFVSVWILPTVHRFVLAFTGSAPLVLALGHLVSVNMKGAANLFITVQLLRNMNH